MRDLEQRLAQRFLLEHPQDAAPLLDQLPAEQAAAALASAGPGVAPVIEQMDRNSAAACLLRYPAEERPALIASLRADLAARLLRLMAAPDREATLAACADPVARPLRRLLRFAEETAGALMDPNPLSAPADFTAAEARLQLEQGADDVLYVVDRSDVLSGMLTIRTLLQAPGEVLLQHLMTKPVPRVSAHAQREAVLAHPAWESHHLLPVVDRAEVLVGVIRYQTMRQLQGDLSAPPPATSLGLALGEMYWTMMSTIVDGVTRAVAARALPREDHR